MNSPEDHDQYMEALARDERALEKAASALDRLATIAERFFEKLYPEKKIGREPTLTSVRTKADEELEATIQGTEATLEQWKDIGPREQAFIDKTTKS